MTDPTPRAIASSRCYLLELPGELRNRIYKYVLIHRDPYKNKDLDVPYTIWLRPPPHYSYVCYYAPGRKHQNAWPRLKRQTLGLTQTCRAIRHEFLPLHLGQIKVEFNFSEDFQQYVSDFFLQSEDANGTCFLGIPRTKDCIEVLPLIQCLSKAPGIILKFDGMQYLYGMRGHDLANMSALVDTKGNSVWREYVEKCVIGIAYYPKFLWYSRKNDQNQLFVNIKHTVGEPWMIEDKKEDTVDGGNSTRVKTPANKPECVRKWLEFVGLSHLDETLDDIGIQVAAADEDSGDDSGVNEDS